MVFSQRVAGNLHMATWDEDSHGIPKEKEEEEEEKEEAISLADDDEEEEVAKAALANAAAIAAAVVEQLNSGGFAKIGTNEVSLLP